MSNRLADESSPYLLQHKDNPVDWYPWGDEAFARARAEDRPIFLSIGYSTCHWCHVMEHESFENPQVAELLNRWFVSIKVDREERPDVDRVYMMFVQATTGSGGWPMSVWLTPALEPFYGGTYYPPTSRWGRPGFTDILQEIARVWREERPNVERSARTIVDRLRAASVPAEGGDVPGVEVLEAAVRQFAASFDARHGGFGGAPKFPRPSELLFLLREHARTGDAAPREMALATLKAMALGGMRDHVGGGFHRYSVDGEWRVPHFEKMLYDQAQLVLALLEAAQASGDPFFRDVAVDTLEYVQRDMTAPEGGFYSAEDADSVPPEEAQGPAPHKKEGAFYVWADGEIGEVLGADADLFRLRYGVRPDGNAPFDPQQEFAGRNLLYTARSLDEVASAAGIPAAEAAERLARAGAALFARRSTRPHPHLDDKVLTSWNELMIAAFARASRDVGPEGAAFLERARRAAAFVRAHLWDGATGTLLRRYRQGSAGVAAYAEDYAALVFGLLELFQADGDPDWLEWALALQQRQDELFWDPRGGWFSTTGGDASVLLRQKDDYDGAEPAASSIAALNLQMLSHLAAGEGPGASTLADAARKVEQTFRAIAGRASELGRAIPMMLAAISTYHAGVTQLVITGDADDGATRALLRAARARLHPALVTVPVDPHRRDRVAQLLPWVAALGARDGPATAYLCRGFTCDAPTSSPAELARKLDAVRP